MDSTVLQIQDGRGLGAELKIQDGGRLKIMTQFHVMSFVPIILH